MTSRPWTRLSLIALSLVAGCNAPEVNPEAEGGARTFLAGYLRDYDQRWREWTRTEWAAAISGGKEDFQAHAKADLALKRLHSDRERYGTLMKLLQDRQGLTPRTRRALEYAELEFKGNQLPPEILDRLATLGAEINQTFNTFRATLDGKKYTNNELLELLAKERSTPRRKAIWEALKQVGQAVGPKLVKLARIRNKGARQLGYGNFWEMKVRLQEHDPEALLATFDELARLTAKPFRRMKETMDRELAARFGVAPDDMMPWHYDNPFFQSPPPSAAVDLDDLYRHLKKEDIPKIAARFYRGLGIEVDDILARSSLYEQEGKDQHAFCEDMDRAGDVRTLCNLKPTAEWMDTMLHELGHAVYDKYLDMSLPFNLRRSAHALTTEGVAMLFGALAKNPRWVVEYTGADAELVARMDQAILEQRRREQLIFCRWTLVMLHFERALYANPDQDLNRLWYDIVGRYQLLRRPGGRDLADWAAKPHFTIAPVYYHNYMLGELFAAQLRATLARKADHRGATAAMSFNGRKAWGDFFKRKVFAPGASLPWPQFVEAATGKRLSAGPYAAEVGG